MKNLRVAVNFSTTVKISEVGKDVPVYVCMDIDGDGSFSYDKGEMVKTYITVKEWSHRLR
ncbi:hypothetical protein DRO64_03425 [Candidatus Bathyarchaeota archaeon]|nr:MAG: hypothetical protein DRO64_03425 [Candidatus Bathyarchaeota archaeon]